jgi:hypothetical protein
MDVKTLFHLGFDHWQALLLSFIPAIITLCIIIHIYSKFPSYKRNKVYLLFLFSMFVYQINDSMSRMSLSEETARSWDRLLVISWSMLVPSGLHWALLLVGRRKLANTEWFLILLYFSSFFFAIPLCAGLYSQPFAYSYYWGWMRTYSNINLLLAVTLTWWCVVFTIMLVLFARFAYKNRNSPDLKFVSLMNLIGFSIPMVTGIIIQLVFPLFFKWEAIPLTSTLMLTTVIVILGLNTHKIFILSETVDSERITEIIQEIILVVSPTRNITYINSYGAKLIGKSEKDKVILNDLFQSESTTVAFERKVLTPCFKKMSPATFQFSMEANYGKSVHWNINTYPIINMKTLEGVLLICRDISDSVSIGEAKLAALRSQMNPHFIFNSLNSIQHYLHTYQREAAEFFLSTFSTLIRQILDNSGKSTIPVSEELNSIELYLKLEKARFGQRLSYEIIVDGNLDVENTLVPSMLIQPYIENAIIHGLAFKENGGKVKIELRQRTEFIMCLVEDDGIGREKAVALKKGKNLRSKSHGMSITEARLDLLNQNLNIPVSVKIKDLFNEKNDPCGTQVIIYMPVNERF